MGEREFVNIAEAAVILNVSRSTVHRMVRRGKLHPEPVNPVHEPHGPVKIPLADVLALLPAADRAAALERLK